MIDLVTSLLLVAACGVMAWIARVDFATLKISNQSIVTLLVLYGLWAVLGGFNTFWTDLVAGLVLFLLSLVMWLWRMLGAGDVKLYAAIGLLVGLDHLLVYTFFLLVVSVLLVVLIQVAGRSTAKGRIFARLRLFRQTGKAPYGVPMCLAAIPSVLLRAFG